MRKILVLRGGALGDFIVTLPALALLRTRWPEARIELAGNPRAAELARTRGLVDLVHSQHEGRWSALYSTMALPPELAAWLGEFDLVLNYWPDPEGELRARFPVRPGQVFLHGEAHPMRGPAAAHYCAPLRALGLETKDLVYPLATPVAEPDDVVAIHPGSGSARKNWPAERWREVIAALPSRVLLILGEAEDAAWRDAVLADFGTRVEIARHLPLEVLVGRLRRSRVFLGHDSGISHLAAACGLPGVLLFGPTDAAIWAPPTPRMRVLQAGPTLEAISVAEVLGALASARRNQT